jgi:hypothetical protein
VFEDAIIWALTAQNALLEQARITALFQQQYAPCLQNADHESAQRTMFNNEQQAFLNQSHDTPR